MNEQECLSKMVAPGTPRQGKWLGGVIQIAVTRACDLSCYNCTQGSNYGGKTEFMSPQLFEQAVKSLQGYQGVVGVFGGNPALSPHFLEYCCSLQRWIPKEQRGLWCNHPHGNGKYMRGTFNPAVSNLNCHLSREAYDEFKRDWPECRPFGLDKDSRHGPVFVSIKDLGVPEEKRWELISKCDINQHWSALIGVFRGEIRAWFCEVAGAQAMLHQYEPDYPDTGSPIVPNPVTPWWQREMEAFKYQVRQHCHDCGVPLRGWGRLAQDNSGAPEQTSKAHGSIAKSKRRRPLQVVTTLEEVQPDALAVATHYLQNSALRSK